MPEFMRGNAVAYLNSSPLPPLDPPGGGERVRHPARRRSTGRRRRGRELPRGIQPPRMLKLLTIHEAYPGHYVQLAYSNRVPSLIRRVLGSGTFASGGWAVYHRADDARPGVPRRRPRPPAPAAQVRPPDGGQRDPRPAGLHAEGMTDEQAMQLLRRSRLPGGRGGRGQDRPPRSSRRPSSRLGFVGRLAFCRLRQKVQRAKATSSTSARFHEAVLSHVDLALVKYLPELYVTDP